MLGEAVGPRLLPGLLEPLAGITQARQRLGYEPVKKLFAGVAAPVAEELTAGAFLGPWRLMAIDGFERDAPDTPENAAASGFAGTAS